MQANFLFFYHFSLCGKLITWLLFVFLSAFLQASQSDPARFVRDFEKFAELDKANPPPAENLTLFTGSSTIRRWTTLSEDFPEIPVLNRGFGGSQLHQVLHHFDDLFPVTSLNASSCIAAKTTFGTGSQSKNARRIHHPRSPDPQDSSPILPVYLSCKPSPKRMSKWAIYQDLNGKIKTFCQKDPLLTFVDLSGILPRSRRQTRYGDLGQGPASRTKQVTPA